MLGSRSSVRIRSVTSPLFDQSILLRPLLRVTTGLGTPPGPTGSSHSSESSQGGHLSRHSGTRTSGEED